MRRDGVITVFLSLILLLFMNFLMTTIEAARITAGKSILSMLTINAGNSIEARYYYPLFKEYGLLAMDGGMGGTSLQRTQVKNSMSDTFAYAEEYTDGGLVKITDCEITSLKLNTLVSNGYKAFTEQVKEQALFEGAELVCDFLADDSLETVGAVAEFQTKQQEACESTAQVSIEILKLMELVDGVCTTSTGLKTDKKGNYIAAEGFAKKMCGADEEKISLSYGDSVIYEVVRQNIFYAKEAAESMIAVLHDYDRLQGAVDRKSTELVIEKMYEAFLQALEKTGAAYSEAIAEAEILIQVQKLAQSDVLLYEQELINATGINEGALSGLFEDLEKLKDYVGLNESGYNGENIKKTLMANRNILQIIALPPLSEFITVVEGEETTETIINTENLEMAFNNILSLIPSLSYENLKFDYGNLQATDDTSEKLKEGLGELFSEGVLNLLGVTEVSDKRIDGTALPSKGKATSQSNDLLTLFAEISQQLAQGDIGTLLKSGYENLSTDFLTEVYLSNHFKSYVDQDDNGTKIAYEREYLLQGHKKDSDNLTAVALRLIALRAVFCFAALLTDVTRNQEATAVAQTMAVFGIPALIYVAKYLILTVWAIEEAIIEVSALLAGKKVSVFNSKGNLSIYELLIVTPALVKTKVESLKDTAGVGYNSYIILLSFIQSNSVKNGRALDLVQENIRYRYRDSFRIGNCITGGSIKVQGHLEKKFSTAFFSDEAYELSAEAEFGY